MKTRIKELRTAKNITQTALALAIGSSQNVISKIELEYTVPDANILCGIADYFHTSVDYLLYRTDQRYCPVPSSLLSVPRINEYLLITEVLFCYELLYVMIVCHLQQKWKTYF